MKSQTRKPVRPAVTVHPEELCIELLYLAGDLKGISPSAAELVALAAGQLEAELREPAQARLAARVIAGAGPRSYRLHA
jgi:hypothetical protein